MKKLMAAILALLLALGLSGCMANVTDIEISGAAAKVELRSEDGALVEISGQEELRLVTENITGMKFERMRPCGDDSGWSYSLRWLDGGGGVLDEVLVMDEGRIVYGGYFYSSLGAGINTAFFDRLLGGAG